MTRLIGAPIRALVLLAVTAALASGCGDSASTPTADTCADFNGLSSTDQATIADDWLARIGDDVSVEPDGNAFASQVSKACEGSPGSKAYEMAAIVATAAEGAGLTQYDQPLP